MRGLEIGVQRISRLAIWRQRDFEGDLDTARQAIEVPDKLSRILEDLIVDAYDDHAVTQTERVSEVERRDFLKDEETVYEADANTQLRIEARFGDDAQLGLGLLGFRRRDPTLGKSSVGHFKSHAGILGLACESGFLGDELVVILEPESAALVVVNLLELKGVHFIVRCVLKGNGE